MIPRQPLCLSSKYYPRDQASIRKASEPFFLGKTPPQSTASLKISDKLSVSSEYGRVQDILRTRAFRSQPYPRADPPPQLHLQTTTTPVPLYAPVGMLQRGIADFYGSGLWGAGWDVKEMVVRGCRVVEKMTEALRLGRG